MRTKRICRICCSLIGKIKLSRKIERTYDYCQKCQDLMEFDFERQMLGQPAMALDLLKEDEMKVLAVLARPFIDPQKLLPPASLFSVMKDVLLKYARTYDDGA